MWKLSVAETVTIPKESGSLPPETVRKTVKFSLPLESSTESIVLPVLGMTCTACQHHVEAALTGAPGVVSARVDLMRHRAAVKFNVGVTTPETLIAAIRESGYDAVLPRSDGASAQVFPEENRIGWKAALAIAAGVLAMLLGMPDGLTRWALLAMTAGLAVWAGGAIYRSAWKALLHRETNMNTLVSLGTGVAFLYSAYGTARPTAMSASYFDSVLLILGFLLLGKWLEGRARHRALAAVDALAGLQPATARVRRDGAEVSIAVDDLKVGDAVVILPGERIPADGVIASGRTTVDESMLTGESMPQARTVGDKILAGSLNYDGAVTATVESAGEGTTLRQIARLVEQAQGSRAPMERLADRASAIFVPVVLVLAVLTFAGWLLAAHSFSLAIAATVAVLVIACPCAMGLAVPAALTVAIGRGAQFGVLIKGGEALERLASLNTVLLDKTGTLTMGKPVLADITALWGFEEIDLLRWAAAAEDRSAHPLAHAVVDAARNHGLAWTPAEEVQAMPGRGLSATVEGRNCLLGNLELMREWSIPVPQSDFAQVSPDSETGVTRLWMAVDGRLAGYFDAKDSLRPSAVDAVRWLKAHGIAAEMLTGDSASAAAPIAAAVGITAVSAGLLPIDKVSRIRALQASGKRIAMVGDGINDAAALAQADAGIAMGAGAALAQEAGDVLLLSNDPVAIGTAIGLSRATTHVMRQNLAWAAGYNVIGIPLAAGLLYPVFHVLLTPWMAAAAMAFSSISVLLNSLRLRSWKPKAAELSLR